VNMSIPLIDVPVSRKAVAAFVAGLVGAGLVKLGVYTVSPEVQALISAAEALAAAVVVGDGVKYANYLADRLRLPVKFDPEA